MARILITNAYSSRNRGDAAIILGMIESLANTDAFRDAEISVSSTDFAADAAAYPVPTVPSFHSLKNGFSRSELANALYFLVVLLPVSLLWIGLRRFVGIEVPLPGSFRRLMRAYAEADLVVAAGGGYLYTTSATHGNVVLMINLFGFFVAVLLDKPVALYAQSIGPFASSAQAWIVRRALARVRLVEVREEWSLRLLESWRLPTDLKLATDAAFLLAERRPACDLPVDRADGVSIVGLTVRNWFRDPERQRDYESTMARFIAWLVDRRDANVVLVPQVTFADGHDDDRVVARRVVAEVDRNDRVRVVEAELSAAEVKWLCGRADLFVGTRMHSNIFALSSGVPTLAIAYQPKTKGIMASLGLDDDVVSIDELQFERLTAMFDRLTARSDEIRATLDRVIPEMRAAAYGAGRMAAEAYLQWRGGDGGAGGRG